MNRDRSPAPTDIPIKGFSTPRGKARCSSTNFKICHPPLRACCCGFWKPAVFVRVGGTQQVHCGVRVMVATNIPIEELSDGRIRSDLIYRLNCLSIEIAPLRDRRQDIRPIAEKCLREELHYLGEVDDGVWQALESCPYPWPGNARELRNVLLRTILVSSRDRLMPADIPSELWHRTQPARGTKRSDNDFRQQSRRWCDRRAEGGFRR